VDSREGMTDSSDNVVCREIVDCDEISHCRLGKAVDCERGCDEGGGGCDEGFPKAKSSASSIVWNFLYRALGNPFTWASQAAL